MYCKNCGAELPEGAKFCKQCGTAVHPSAAPENQAVASENQTVNTVSAPVAEKSSRVPVMAVIAVVAVLIVAVLLFRTVGGSSSYEKPLDNFFTGITELDMNKVMKALPDEISDQMDTTSVQSVLDTLSGYLNGAEFSVSYEIVYEGDLPDETVNNMQQSYLNAGIELKHDIKAAKEVTLRISASVFGGEETVLTDNLSVDLIKLNGSWYIDTSSLWSLLSFIAS